MSELRQDLVSGDWVIIAPGRAARPQFLDVKRPARKPSPRVTCPFEESFLRKNGDWANRIAFPGLRMSDVFVVPNKYPALAPAAVCSTPLSDGIYTMRSGVGEHDLIITRDHSKNFAELKPRVAEEVFVAFQKLCRRALNDPCTIYAVPFWNWGPLAGASVWHPHYQFLSLPVIPAHSARSIAGAAEYAKKKHECARCEIIQFERSVQRNKKQNQKSRIIAENAGAIAIAPYASKLPFEIRVMPKRHGSYFYKASPTVIRDTVRIVQEVLQKLKKNLNDPDLNAFIHEAPLDGKSHHYHHWHIEIIPRVSTPAGFELSTGIYINSSAPEAAAATLRARK
jgi:UDPglucose--hexose-1-phosphate uridylyltransferase